MIAFHTKNIHDMGDKCKFCGVRIESNELATPHTHARTTLKIQFLDLGNFAWLSRRCVNGAFVVVVVEAARSVDSFMKKTRPSRSFAFVSTY